MMNRQHEPPPGPVPLLSQYGPRDMPCHEHGLCSRVYYIASVKQDRVRYVAMGAIASTDPKTSEHILGTLSSEFIKTMTLTVIIL
jgi:hypothetical protein